MSPKQQALELVQQMHDESSTTELSNQLLLLMKLWRGIDDVQAGRVNTHQEVVATYSTTAKNHD